MGAFGARLANASSLAWLADTHEHLLRQCQQASSGGSGVVTAEAACASPASQPR
jgi:hypothetical protein